MLLRCNDIEIFTEKNAICMNVYFTILIQFILFELFSIKVQAYIFYRYPNENKKDIYLKKKVYIGSDNIFSTAFVLRIKL